MRLTLQRPVGIGICPHACPKGRAMISNLKRVALQKSVPIAGLFYIPPKKRERGFPPVIIGTKREVHISKPKAGAPCDKQQ